jgi:luciferase family oxidoreductase group 1
VAKPSPIPLSVLDTAPVWKGSTPAKSLRDMMDLARNVERLGYRRFWVAEHHNTLSIASSSPAVLVGQLANVTTTLRVGSGGVMLPNHPPLVVAEQFGTLEALNRGRIDLGIGRAPGTDSTTAKALRRTTGEVTDEDFSRQIAELMAYFDGPAEPSAGINAIPAEDNGPPVWLLGSSSSSARLAGRLGLPYACAHHLRPDNTLAALEVYRQSFTPSAALAEPYVLVSAMVIAADTQERAEWLSTSLGMMILKMSGGQWPQDRHTPPEEAAAYPYTSADTALIKERLSTRIIGGPATVRREIRDLLAGTEADELMVMTLIHGQTNRIRSYELVAEAMASEYSGSE